VVSVPVGAVPFAGSGCRREICGRDGTLVATGAESRQLGEVFWRGAKGDNTLAPMSMSERLAFAAPGMPSGEAREVGQMYRLCHLFGVRIIVPARVVLNRAAA
jgi:hypothetical protein